MTKRNIFKENVNGFSWKSIVQIHCSFSEVGECTFPRALDAGRKMDCERVLQQNGNLSLSRRKIGDASMSQQKRRKLPTRRVCNKPSEKLTEIYAKIQILFIIRTFLNCNIYSRSILLIESCQHRDKKAGREIIRIHF